MFSNVSSHFPDSVRQPSQSHLVLEARDQGRNGGNLHWRHFLHSWEFEDFGQLGVLRNCEPNSEGLSEVLFVSIVKVFGLG